MELLEMNVAIVGTSISLTENEERDLRQFIALVLKRYDIKNDIIISGGSKGVDSMGIEIAKGLGFKTQIYKPEKEEWYYYKKRNLQIAKDCNELHCFSVPVHKTKCYHHDEPQEHEKTAGCWTGSKAQELDKPCQLVVVPQR
ncbi:MAG: hypothetical protein ACRD9Q_08085 [Nitrososphaeraceae archaeon]